MNNRFRFQWNKYKDSQRKAEREKKHFQEYFHERFTKSKWKWINSQCSNYWILPEKRNFGEPKSKLALHKKWSFPLSIFSVFLHWVFFQSHLMKNSLMKNFIFCAVLCLKVLMLRREPILWIIRYIALYGAN